MKLTRIVNKSSIFLPTFFCLGQLLALVVLDFDTVKRQYSFYKDDKGSTVFFSPISYDEKQGNILKLSYDIVKGGWGGWICLLDKLNAEGYEFLTFRVKGEQGGEKFELGLKDASGQETKLQIEKYATISTQWKQVKIPLSEFKEVNLSSLENISIGFNEYHGRGTVYIDDIQLEGVVSEQAKETPVVRRKKLAEGKTVKVLIDGFERTNPYDFYKVWKGDNSSLNLASSRVIYEGDYSMEMEYVLSTDKTIGSWVSARYDFPRVVSWLNVRSLRIYVKGDGSDNIFRIQIIDKDGELWYVEDKLVLKSPKWQQVKFYIEDFRLLRRTGNGVLDLDEIQSYELMILSKYEGTYTGKIYVDQFVVEGVEITAEEVSVPGIVEKLRLAVPTVGNIYLTGSIYNEYIYAPEEGKKLIHWGKLIADGRVEMFSARVELASYGQSFGEAASVAYDYNKRPYTITKSPELFVPNIQLMINNFSPFLSNVTIGNIWTLYSKYSFVMPGWGFKGVTAEGDIGKYNYHLLYIVQPYDSYTLGTRLIRYFRDTKVVFYGVYNYETAKNVGTESTLQDGTLRYTSGWNIEPVSEDKTYNIELWRWFLDRRIQLQAIMGINDFVEYAEADYSDPYSPTYSRKLDKPQTYYDSMYYGRVEISNLYLPGVTLAYNYRYIGTNYKPRFRDSPAWFDDYEGDQKGYNIRTHYWWQGFSVSCEYDDLTRLSDSKDYRRKIAGSLGYYGFRGIDFSYYYETREEKYIFDSIEAKRTRFTIYRNPEKLDVHEIYVRNQLTPKIAWWFRIKREFIKHLNKNTDSLFTKLEYFISSNTRLFAEYKITRYPERSWEPIGWPFDDNYTKVCFELWF
ncbi:MAG: CIA30 family protein [Endomicrobia bacterium]|nr:CIA30 family protein [Endomicrobiia bacterium]